MPRKYTKKVKSTLEPVQEPEPEQEKEQKKEQPKIDVVPGIKVNKSSFAIKYARIELTQDTSLSWSDAMKLGWQRVRNECQDNQ